MDVPKCIEDAFWKRKPLQGRQVTPAAVLTAFGKDATSFRSGLFLEKLCLQNILLDNRKVTPDQVIRELNRKPYRKKYLVAIARFKAECCLRGLVLNNRRISPDEVVNDYQVARATLELGRFKAECCLRGLALHGRQVTPDAVVKAYQAAGATLEIARFMEECCMRGLVVNGQRVAADTVFKGYQAAGATLELARFQEKCCLRGLWLNGQQVTPDEVVRGFPDSPLGKLGIARFKEHCFLRGWSLNGQPITPDEVVRGFPDSPSGKLGMARFKAECCLGGLALNDQPVTPDSVVKDFQSTSAMLESARFKEQCCLRGLLLKGQPVTPDMVARDFPDSPEGKLALARFKEQCCLKGLVLNGRTVTPDAVVKAYLASPESKLSIMRFREYCCLKGLALHGQQVTPDAVVKDYQAAGATLEIARFMEECCMSGLVLNGQQVAADAVLKGYQAAGATLEIAHLQGKCCLRGLLLNGQQVTPDEVVRGFPDSPQGKLGIARFKAECCLRGLALNGQQVKPEAVVQDFPDSPEGKLGIARFKAECCLMGLVLNGQQVTPEAVVRSFPDSPEGKLGIARFKEQCCLRYLALNGQQVPPEAVVKDFQRGGWLLERAIFYSQLALNARELNNTWLDHQSVLAAFNELPGDHSSRQARYLIQQLQQSRGYDETNEVRDLFQEAWQILGKVSVRDDEQHRLQCILTFMAMQHELTIDRQVVSAEQVLRSIKTLRHSFQNSRIHFFFLAHCYIAGQSINGQEIHKGRVLGCLQHFPAGSKLRHALGHWFEQYSPGTNIETGIIDSVLFNRADAVATRSDRPYAPASQFGDFVAMASVAVRREPPLAKAGFPEQQVSRLNVLTQKALEIIQKINDACSDPNILITGSYARFLQGICPSFNDIDIICTTDDCARTLFGQLQALGSGSDAEIPRSIIIKPIPGCPAIKLPTTYNIYLNDGDLGMKAMGLQVIIDTALAHGNTAPLAFHVAGVNRPVWCLSFAGETGLLNNTLEYLADNLDPLTERLQRGEVFSIPRTLLFNCPQTPDEHIYGLLMRSLLTLNKARQFISLHCESKSAKPDCQTIRLQKHDQQKHCPQKQRLQSLTRNLQMKLNSHVYRHDFEHRVNNWLLMTPHVNDYEISKKDFITALLALMHPEYQAFQ
ncbi:hypothetical protein [Endozoicomonas sp. SESOKO1]|uniref:hypothetical protein n=1 Tax=Endozoicomonas sp. SESOKO1 TaxID=2828742 RepID=UPI0021498FE5|nr:hypothetical protein [Endozoicomonas sp. SESOKO1]